jgi:tetratricopeptide (TPR) repeat protein
LLCVALIALATNALADSATVNSAREALRLQQPARAAKLYSQALQSPNLTARERAEVLINRGLAYDQLGQPKDAVTDFTQAIALKVLDREGLAKALLDRGIALDEMGEADAAINDYTAAIAAAPDFPAALNNRGNAYRRRGDLRSARADYEASLVKGNRTPEYPLYGLGQIAEAEGNPHAALGFYQQAFAANPAFDLVAQRLAALQSGQGAEPAPKQPQPAPSAPRPSPGSATPPQNAVVSLGNEAPPLRPKIVDEPAKQGGAASGARVQLGAYRSRGEAEANWQRLISASNDLLGTLKPNIVKAEIAGKGTYYRLRTGVPDGQDANAFCRTLRARGLDCVVVKG